MRRDHPIHGAAAAGEIAPQSDAEGNLEFFNVRIGGHAVTTEKAGFSVALVDGVQVTGGERRRVDVQMR